MPMLGPLGASKLVVVPAQLKTGKAVSKSQGLALRAPSRSDGELWYSTPTMLPRFVAVRALVVNLSTTAPLPYKPPYWLVKYCCTEVLFGHGMSIVTVGPGFAMPCARSCELQSSAPPPPPPPPPPPTVTVTPGVLGEQTPGALQAVPVKVFVDVMFPAQVCVTTPVHGAPPLHVQLVGCPPPVQLMVSAIAVPDGTLPAGAPEIVQPLGATGVVDHAT